MRSGRHILACWLACELVMGGAASLLGSGPDLVTRWAPPAAGVLLLAGLVLGGAIRLGPAAGRVAAGAAGAVQLAVVALVWGDPRPTPAWKALITIVAAVGAVLCAAVLREAEPRTAT